MFLVLSSLFFCWKRKRERKIKRSCGRVRKMISVEKFQHSKKFPKHLKVPAALLSKTFCYKFLLFFDYIFLIISIPSFISLLPCNLYLTCNICHKSHSYFALFLLMQKKAFRTARDTECGFL